MSQANDFKIEDDVLLSYEGTDENVVIPEGITSIAEKAFKKKTIKSVQIPDTVDWIGSEAFCNTALEEVVLPASLQFLQDGTFAECSNLKKAVLPNGLIGLGGDVFQYCNQLEPLQIPKSVCYLYGNYFGECVEKGTHSISSSVTASPTASLEETINRIQANFEQIEVVIPSSAKKLLEFGRFSFYSEKKSQISKFQDSSKLFLNLGSSERVRVNPDGTRVFSIFVDIPTFDEFDREYDSYEKMTLFYTPEKNCFTAVIIHGGYSISSITLYENVHAGNSMTKYFLKVLKIGEIVA